MGAQTGEMPASTQTLAGESGAGGLVNVGSKDPPPPSLNFLTVAILLVGWNHLDLRMRYESPGFFGGFLISSMNSLLSEKVLAMRAL